MKLSLLAFACLAAAPVFAQDPAPVQTYYVPLPEDELFDTFDAINAPQASGNVNSAISIAAAADGTKVYYDHWEDGYDPNPTNPSLRQSTTEVFDLDGGDVEVLESAITSAGGYRSPSTLFYDGADKILASLPIAVTRFAFPDSPGSLMAGAVEIFNKDSWGQ